MFVCVSCELSALRLAAAKMSRDVGRRFLMSRHLRANVFLQRGRWRDLQPVRVRGRGLQRAGRQEADEADPGGSGLPPPEQCGPSGPEGQSVGMNMLLSGNQENLEENKQFGKVLPAGVRTNRCSCFSPPTAAEHPADQQFSSGRHQDRGLWSVQDGQQPPGAQGDHGNSRIRW